MKNLRIAMKISFISIFLVVHVMKCDTTPSPSGVPTTKSNITNISSTDVKTENKDKRKLAVKSSTTGTKNDRKLCPCSGRKLEIMKSKINKDRKLVSHETGGVRRVDMYQGKPNMDTVSNNLMTQNQEPVDPSDYMVGNDGQILAMDCCVNKFSPIELDKPQIIIEPMGSGNHDPMLGLLSGLLQNAERVPVNGRPHVTGFIQMTKEHVLPNGQVEIEKMNEPMQSTPNGIVLGHPHIQMDMENPMMSDSPFTGEDIHRVELQGRNGMINPITGLLSMLPHRIPQKHEVIIAMSKPEIHTIEIPMPHSGMMGQEQVIMGRPNPLIGNDILLNRLIGDIMMHHERPDVDIEEWHQRNNPPLPQNRIVHSEDDINNMLMGLMNHTSNQNRALKMHLQKPVKVEMEMDIPMKLPVNTYHELRKQQISNGPDLNDLMGMINSEHFGPSITHSKTTKKRKLKKEKSLELDNGVDQTNTKITKEQKFLNDLEHLGDSDKKLHKFKRKYKKYLSGLERMYSKTSDKFKKMISKAHFMKRALKNKTLFKQFLIKDLRRRNRKLKKKLEKESKRLMNGINGDLNDKLIGLSLKRKLNTEIPIQNNPFVLPAIPEMMFNPFTGP